MHAPSEVPARYRDAYNATIEDTHRRTFAGMLSCMDEGIGNVTSALKAKRLLDESLIIFTTDNGAAQFSRKTKGGKTHLSSGPYRGRKRDNWEGGHRVPFIARWPGVVEPATVTSPVLCLPALPRTHPDK